MDFPRIVRSLRKEKQILQSDYARMLEIPVSHVSRFECGYGLPNWKVVRRMSEVLDVDCRYLYEIKTAAIEGRVCISYDEWVERALS